MLVVLFPGNLGVSGGQAVTLLSLGLPLRGKSPGVSRDAGPERMSIQDLSWGRIGCVAQLQESSGEVFAVNIARWSCFQNEILDGFDCCFCVAVGLRVVR